MRIHSIRIRDREIYFVLSLLLNLCIFSTNNILMAKTKYIALLYILVYLVYVFASGKNTLKISLNTEKILISLFFLLACFGSILMDSNLNIKDFIIYFVMGILIVFGNLKQSFFEMFYTMFKYFFWFFIFTMYFNSFLPDLFYKLFNFASFGDAAFRAATDGGAIAGIAFEKAYAAFLCNLGIGVTLSEYVVSKDKRKFVELALIFIALMMTGKRTLFFIPIIMIFVYTVMFNKNNRILKVAKVMIVLLVLLFMAYMFVPGVDLVIERIINGMGSDNLSGRENLWEYAMEMFNKSPIFGTGFASFNDYAYSRGFLYYGERWNYYAHNVYFELLAETGVFGFSLFISLLVTLFFKTIKRAKKYMNVKFCFLVYWLMLFIVYSSTGNTIYYPCQMVILFLMIYFVSDKNEREGKTLGTIS